MNNLTYKQFYEHLKTLLSRKQATLEEVITFVKTTQIVVTEQKKEVKDNDNRKHK